MILMIDNYDSFTYNLVQYFRELNEKVLVYRNDEIRLDQVEALNPDLVVISPGPCTPNQAGISMNVVREFKDRFPILGICLGHQAIGQVFGAKIVKTRELVHGKVHSIIHKNIGVFEGLKNPLNVTRYHSLIIDRDTLPDCLEVTAVTCDGEIMGILHKEYMIEGVQFHPEAILTEQGHELLENFIRRSKR